MIGEKKRISRRDALALGACGLALVVTPTSARAAGTESLVAEFTGGAFAGPGPIRIEVPAEAENGASVPVRINCPGAEAIRLIAPSNPTPVVFTFNFGPLAGARTVATRIRMAETQPLTAVARMEDGGFVQTSVSVAVSLSGCA